MLTSDWPAYPKTGFTLYTKVVWTNAVSNDPTMNEADYSIISFYRKGNF